MADSPNKRLREARKRRKAQEKAERKRLRIEGNLGGPRPVRIEDFFGTPPPPPPPRDPPQP